MWVHGYCKRLDMISDIKAINVIWRFEMWIVNTTMNYNTCLHYNILDVQYIV